MPRRLRATRWSRCCCSARWRAGEAATGSDADILVVVDPRLALQRGLYRAWDARPVAWRGRPVDAHFVHPPGDDALSGLWAEAALDGVGAVRARHAGVGAPRPRSPRHGRGPPRPAGGSRAAVLDGGVMRNRSLASDYVRRASARLLSVDVLYDAESWADVVRGVPGDRRARPEGSAPRGRNLSAARARRGRRHRGGAYPLAPRRSRAMMPSCSPPPRATCGAIGNSPSTARRT